MRFPTLARVALLGLALAFVLMPTAQAQILSPQIGGFGTQVKVGDDDYVPLMKGAKSWGVAEYDGGVKGDVRDACILLIVDMSASAHKNVAGKTHPVNKDIRLTPCAGHPAGSLIGDDDAQERMHAYTVRLNSSAIAGGGGNWLNLTFMDLDGSTKYNKGDLVYLVVGTANPGDRLVATEGPGSWTLRLTPALGLAAGTFVFTGDADFEAYHLSGPTKAQSFGISEREDKGWYLIPGTFGATSPAAANTPLPVNALRVGIKDTFGLQPNAIPTGVELGAPDNVEAGKAFPLIVTVTNTGARAGQGVILTKIDGQIADVRLSPVLSPGEATKVLVTVTAPHGGLLAIDVNDIFTSATAKGSAAAGAASAAAAASPDLTNQVHDLQARLDALEAKGVPANLQTKGSPTLAPLALVALAGVAMLLRRRAA